MMTTVYLDGNKIHRMRVLQGLTLRDLAEKSGISANTINSIERRGKSPRFHPPTLKALADALGVETVELIGEDDE